ncbi:genetic competence negative regulator [Longirhabdus pacifica]|uniref:genetic competence negative regulator n=1 Tax=Longirhabdus pacifica TaxID=2305227 RepID=UPI001008AC20|nr:genetic competence negative regulator [Longirhabdus pacifica]
MKIERLSQDKIRIFLTFDDLVERGIQKDDMWREIPKVHELFSDMMDQAYTELGFEAIGPLGVEVFSLPAQGMVVIVTKGKFDHDKSNEEMDDIELEEHMYDMQVTMDDEEDEWLTVSFADFEDLVSAVHRLHLEVENGGTLYHYQNQYVLQFSPFDSESTEHALLDATLLEYGEKVVLTEAFLVEYGKVIIAENALEVIKQHFNS